MKTRTKIAAKPHKRLLPRDKPASPEISVTMLRGIVGGARNLKEDAEK